MRQDWFNRLRWGAGLGVMAAVAVAHLWLDSQLPLVPLLVVGASLLLLNVLYVARNRRYAPVDLAAELRLVKLQMLGDLVVLTVLLNLSGGIENPLLFLYVIHVILASLLFRGREIFQIAWLAIVLLTGEAAGEFFNILPHHHLFSASEMAHQPPFILMTLASFWLVVLFSAHIGASIMRHNRAIKDDLVRRQAALIKADQDKMDFFRFVTHEIKSPITTAQSAVETALELGGSQLPPRVDDMLVRAVGRLEQATDIVMNLADLTRGGDLRQEAWREVDLNELAAVVAAGLADQADRRRVTIQTVLPPSPVTLTTSATMIEKILANLVSNAVRYDREGGRVWVRVRDLGARVRLEVQDEGIGIAPADQGRVFEEFYRTPAAKEMSHLGTGLGLPIVKRFVAQLGGEISLRSAVGEGATFTVELPRDAAGPAAGAAAVTEVTS